jgi:hypothetical protein
VRVVLVAGVLCVRAAQPVERKTWLHAPFERTV